MERHNNLTPVEMGVLRAIQAELDAGHERVPIRDIAAAAYTSPSSVVRLAKKLGCSGYSALLFTMKAEMEARHLSDTVGLYPRALARPESIDALRALAADLAAGSVSRVHVVGAGYSAYVASYFVQRLQEQGIFATEKSPLDFADNVPVMVIFVSESGETHDLTFIQERCSVGSVEDFVFSADVESTLCAHARRCAIIQRTDIEDWANPHYFVANCLVAIENVIVQMRAMQEGRTREISEGS